MPTLRFALAQFDFPVGAVAANASRMRDLANEAGARGAALIAFPEQSLCGYPAEDLLLRPGFLSGCERELASLAREIDGITAVVGHPHAVGEIYNAASVIVAHEILATYHKQALPNYTVFDEKRYFRPGHEPLVFDCDGVRVGVIICEDIWEPEPAARAAANGAQFLLVINASPYDTQQAITREALLAQRARENDLPIAYVNVIGGQDDLLFDGASLLVASNGEVVARAPAFEEHLLWVEFDADAGKLRAIDWPEHAQDCGLAILYAGLVRGVRDYVHKNGF
ncbi:MAG: nitrilase-related carbon-nitrogen hydrolase, partial [Rhodanobacteraceae bacterium]